MVRREGVVERHYIPSWVKGEMFGDIVENDPIKVSGEVGAFTFLHTHVKDGVVTDIIAHGGTNGHETVRAFRPERVSKVVAKRSRRKATADVDEG